MTPGWRNPGTDATGRLCSKVMDEDLDLLKVAERTLSEIDRTAGLIDRHADVLAALRIRIEGGPRKSLKELMEAAGRFKGQDLTEKLAQDEDPKRGMDELLARPEKKKGSLDDLFRKDTSNP